MCRSPAGSAPCLEWPDRRVSASSGEVIAELESKGIALDGDLSATEREAGEALQALAEGPVYFACLYARFAEPLGWRYQKPVVRGAVPRLLAPFTVAKIRRAQIRRCTANGFKHRSDFAKGITAVNQLSDALADDAFVLGDDIQVADCAVWSSLVHAAYTKSDNPVRHVVRKDVALMRYLNRVADLADWELPPLNLSGFNRTAEPLHAMTA